MEWISVKERFPPSFERVLFLLPMEVWTGFVQISLIKPFEPIWWSANAGNLNGSAPFLCKEPTHWTPLCALPQDKDSSLYFMTKMTQEEFEDRKKGIEMRPFEFNKINTNRCGGDVSTEEMGAVFEKAREDQCWTYIVLLSNGMNVVCDGIQVAGDEWVDLLLSGGDHSCYGFKIQHFELLRLRMSVRREHIVGILEREG